MEKNATPTRRTLPLSFSTGRKKIEIMGGYFNETKNQFSVVNGLQD